MNLAAGKLYEIANELPSAEIAYRRAVSEDSNLHEAAARLVVVLIKQGQFQEAIEIGNDLFRKAPTAVFKSLVYEGPLSLCTILGDAYRISGNLTVASGFYREAAKLEQGTPYAVSQAVLTMAWSGDAKGIAQLAEEYPRANVSERIAAIMRLSRETDERLAIVTHVPPLGGVHTVEAMLA
jgi:tetratricopeptide (TPR) repeat protein